MFDFESEDVSKEESDSKTGNKKIERKKRKVFRFGFQDDLTGMVIYSAFFVFGGSSLDWFDQLRNTII
ncbi:hypothetical protein HGG82_14320 [Marinomonas sp. M1K-6]|uniref:Uncharacterized protein n=1 Tax=Marinomonas profundi TaxID=2726122 RepID=A0A847QZJ6_9GAMM|nr:hypothetical protein [Marinomonas profundi]NLQ18779.1 hypothetical protein [Marinomonas profundi]UDV02286.1 hypothetical protein J8N69_11865 [Marinomonas profundi]